MERKLSTNKYIAAFIITLIIFFLGFVIGVFVEEIKYWTLSDKIKASCNEDIVRILFFFALDCDECVNQGFVLDYFKKLFGDRLLVFSFNSKLAEEEPLVNTLIPPFNITKYPSLVIEDQKIEGFNDRDAIKEQICNYYRQKPEN